MRAMALRASSAPLMRQTVHPKELTDDQRLWVMSLYHSLNVSNIRQVFAISKILYLQSVTLRE